MSVISTQSEKMNKLKILFVGANCSGKTYALELLMCRLLEINPLFTYQRISLRGVMRNMFGFDGVAAREVSHILRQNYIVQRVCECINEDKDVILIDDLCYDSDVEYLKERFGFHVVLLRTPWHIRFDRIRKKCANPMELLYNIDWFTHASEVNVDRLGGCEYIAVEEKEVPLIIEKIITTI